MGGRGASGGGYGGGGGGSTAGRAPRLPDLTGTGSEKQVNWANNIRQTALNALDTMERNYDIMLKRWQGAADVQSLSKAERNRRAAFTTEQTLGYNKTDVATARADLVKTFQDQRADAKLIIDRRNVFSPSAVERTVKTYANRRRRR